MTLPTLFHFSRDPLAVVRSTAQDLEPWFKPRGLWVSADTGEDSWPAWCRSENFAVDRLRCATEVLLCADAAVLHITSVLELKVFNNRYRGRGLPDYLAHLEFPWAAVAGDFQGIIIAPYLWESRTSKVRWYYTWDCASGCIWDAGAVAELVPRPDLERLPHQADHVPAGEAA